MNKTPKVNQLYREISSNNLYILQSKDNDYCYLNKYKIKDYQIACSYTISVDVFWQYFKEDEKEREKKLYRIIGDYIVIASSKEEAAEIASQYSKIDYNSNNVIEIDFTKSRVICQTDSEIDKAKQIIKNLILENCATVINFYDLNKKVMSISHDYDKNDLINFKRQLKENTKNIIEQYQLLLTAEELSNIIKHS